MISSEWADGRTSFWKESKLEATCGTPSSVVSQSGLLFPTQTTGLTLSCFLAAGLLLGRDLSSALPNFPASILYRPSLPQLATNPWK